MGLVPISTMWKRVGLDLSRIDSGPVARLGCFSFELDGAFAS